MAEDPEIPPWPPRLPVPAVRETGPQGGGSPTRVRESPAPARETPHRSRTRRRRRNRRLVAGTAVAIVALLVPVVWSWVDALRAPGTDSLFTRSVEWVRHQGGNGLVNTAERWYYTTIAAPKEGGRPDEIRVGGRRGDSRTTPIPTTPATTLPLQALRLSPPATPVPTPAAVPEPGEGAWAPAGSLVAGFPALYTTFVRPDAVHTSYYTALMWIDTTLLKTVYVRGLQQPGNGPGPWGARIPEDVRRGVIGSFNSGFQIIHARGGAFADGEEVRPLRAGGASLVVKTDGTATVGVWGRDFVMGPDIAAVRQNLELIIDGGRLNPELREDDTSAFGATVGNNVYVWRSGIGITASGALVYAGGPAMSITSLARTLLAAGAVRAMELDINHDWVGAYIYAPAPPGDPAVVYGEKLHDGMSRDGSRFLTPGVIDFFALFADPKYPTPTPTTTTPTTTTPKNRR